MVQERSVTDDSFSDLDAEIEENSVADSEPLDIMKDTHCQGSNCCSFATFVSVDIDTLTREDMDNENWQDDFFAELGPSTKQPHTEESTSLHCKCHNQITLMEYITK